jgi:DNA-binding NtrC family response regulator
VDLAARIPEDERPQIEVAIVRAPETIGLAEAIENLLLGASDFEAVRFESRPDWGIRPCGGVVGASANPDVVVLPLQTCPAKELASIFTEVQRTLPKRPILVAAANPAVDIYGALEMGASDFFLPPVQREELFPRIRRQARVMQRADVRVRQLKERIGLKQIVGESAVLLEEIQRVPRFAHCDATVLISGESGTGKEIFARAIHYLSPRASAPFVPVNCGALPEELMESEIFGHQRGAFTGAATEQIGLIGEAEGGTLFLDEVDALTPQAQVKLLRFLQDREYRAVGSQRIRHADVRIVAAANTDLGQLVSKGKFREDLYYRLNVLALAVPALRERRGDIPLLTQYFLEKQGSLTKAPPKKLSLPALNRLLSHSWPGNVRELENVLTRAVVLCDHDTIEGCDLELPEEEMNAEDQSFSAMKSRFVRRFEHDFLETALRAHDGNVTRAARALKKNRRALWELLRKHDLLNYTKRR